MERYEAIARNTYRVSAETFQHLLILLDLLLVDLLVVVIIAGRDGRHRRFATAGCLIDVHAVFGVVVSASHYRDGWCSINAPKAMVQCVGLVWARRCGGGGRAAAATGQVCAILALGFPKECL